MTSENNLAEKPLANKSGPSIKNLLIPQRAGILIVIIREVFCIRHTA
jgi:hypothetical protein